MLSLGKNLIPLSLRYDSSDSTRCVQFGVLSSIETPLADIDVLTGSVEWRKFMISLVGREAQPILSCAENTLVRRFVCEDYGGRERRTLSQCLIRLCTGRLNRCESGQTHFRRETTGPVDRNFSKARNTVRLINFVSCIFRGSCYGPWVILKHQTEVLRWGVGGTCL